MGPQRWKVCWWRGGGWLCREGTPWGLSEAKLHNEVSRFITQAQPGAVRDMVSDWHRPGSQVLYWSSDQDTGNPWAESEGRLATQREVRLWSPAETWIGTGHRNVRFVLGLGQLIQAHVDDQDRVGFDTWSSVCAILLFSMYLLCLIQLIILIISVYLSKKSWKCYVLRILCSGNEEVHKDENFQCSFNLFLYPSTDK